MVGMPAQPRPTQGTVLLVEDDPQLAELFTTALEREGYSVDHAANGQIAVAYLAGTIPDVIVSDVMMPEMNGLEFLSRLRADPDLRHIPTIMLTTRSAVEDVVTGLDLGADDYLAKPVDLLELVARVRTKVERPPVPADALYKDRRTGLLTEQAFTMGLESELARARRGRYSCSLARLRLYELERLLGLFGARIDASLSRPVSQIIEGWAGPLDLLGRAADGSFLILMPETSVDAVRSRLETLTQTIVRTTFTAAGEQFRLTPLTGFAEMADGDDAALLKDKVAAALEHAATHLDLRPICFEPAMLARNARRSLRVLKSLRERLEPYRLPAQIVATYVIGWLIPFGLYVLLGSIGLDITGPVYWTLVIILTTTALLIWVESLLAHRRVEPPDVPEESFGSMTAIIAAYLPNEAATVQSTIEAFLRLDYPGPLQIILAYNTPFDMPIESTLQEIAARDRRFTLVRVHGSTSKAQNVNAAISQVTGEVVAIYDADHQPDPDAFRRAWRWIASGSDIVQGHCLIRNGDASWVARMVAVEFEMIYCVSHPGRARLHDFGIFGGSNGFWRSDLLREIRMRGSMLTEDIDSALRAVEAGYKITSDPYLISRELAPTTLKALTNQRLRWAQGWFQVTKKRIGPAMRAPRLSLRQKIGMFHLLAWREAFPWVSMQIIPIVAYWIWSAGSVTAVNWFVPLLLCLSLFIFATGPGQIVSTYRLADPQIRARKDWFWHYLLTSTFFYSGYKNILARVATLKEFLNEKAWKVTPR